jgi:hypothetical protein
VKIVCLICGKAIAMRQEDDVVTLPDAESFRRDHAGCLQAATGAIPLPDR